MRLIKLKTILVLTMLFLASSFRVEAQSENRLLDKVFVPYQWEIYNTMYKRRYWDFRDNYDYLELKGDYTFKRRYQGTVMSGQWTYDKKKDKIVLNVASPFQKEIILKVDKLSRKGKLIYHSSEEDYKVKMYMEEGEIPTLRKKK